MWLKNIKVMCDMNQEELVTVINTLGVGEALVSIMDKDSGDLMVTVIDQYNQANRADITTETTIEELFDVIDDLGMSI